MLGGRVDNYKLKGITMFPALASAGGEVTTREGPMTLLQPNCPRPPLLYMLKQEQAGPNGWAVFRISWLPGCTCPIKKNISPSRACAASA
jgi:hypothetical protein